MKEIVTLILITVAIISSCVAILIQRKITRTVSNKNCPKCNCKELSLLRSLNVKKCTSCGHEIPWHLDPGQLPLVRSNRMVKRDKP